MTGRRPNAFGDLKRKIEESLEVNCDQKEYIPAMVLDSLLSPSVVRDCIAKSAISPHQHAEVVDRIIHGGRGVLATLIRLDSVASIVDFLENDQFMGRPLDSRLPFSEQELSSVLDSHTTARFFWEQWKISIPVFRPDMSHRLLHKYTRFPFISSKFIGEGGSGRVFEVELDPRTQRECYPHTPQIHMGTLIVRKEVPLVHQDDGAKSECDPAYEGEILSLLRLVKHPCLLRLLTSYTYKDTYNFLFPRADCDLHNLVEHEERHPDFRADHAFLQALQGLCSAIVTVHEYTCPEFGLNLKGYHHDLKPENILIFGKKFVLSDFGLSNLKHLSQRTKTRTKDVLGYYIPPEYPSITNNFQPTEVGQQSDIWALGCIFTVVLTYIQAGAKGVQEFERARVFTERGWTTYQFHRNGRVSPDVLSWLDKLGHKANPEGLGLLKLIKEMLQIKPETRPNARTISSRMEFLAVKSLYHSIERLFKAFAGKVKDININVELERFEQFGEIIGLNMIDHQWPRLPGLSSVASDFNVVQGQLLSLYEVFNLPVESLTNPFSVSVHHQIQTVIDNLWNMLSHQTRTRLNKNLERQFLSTTDTKLLGDMHDALGVHHTYRHLGLLAAIKRMILLLRNSHQSTNCKFLLQSPSVRFLEAKRGDIYKSKAFEPAEIMPRGTYKWRRVLVEWLEYNERLNKEEQLELQLRADALAELLNFVDKPDNLRCLRCIGYYHNSLRHAFGFFFEYPPVLNGVLADHNLLRPVPLASLLRGGKRKEQERATRLPSLTYRLHLAKSLAISVLEWHKVGWMHRGLSAFNIIFLESKVDAVANSDPFIMGFSRSRPDEEEHFTMGPPEDKQMEDYCHPNYLRFLRHRLEYDYYSLGMVLLEIGHWRTLKSMTKGIKEKDRSPEKVLEYLLEEYVDDGLDSKMGLEFQNIVRTCLTLGEGNNSTLLNSPEAQDIMEEFQEKVVARLEKCYI